MRTARASGDRRPRTDGTSTIPTSRTAGGLVGLAGRSRARLAAPARADGDRVVRAPPGGTGDRSADGEDEERRHERDGVPQMPGETIPHSFDGSIARMPETRRSSTRGRPGRSGCPTSRRGRPGRSRVRCGHARCCRRSRTRSRAAARAGSTAGAAPPPTPTTCGSTSAGGCSRRRSRQGLPVVLLLIPRLHYADPGDLPDELAGELGILLARVERAIRSIGEIGRVHLCRWGDGSEHLHWWFWPGRRGSRSSTAASPRSGTTSSRRRP